MDKIKAECEAAPEVKVKWKWAQGDFLFIYLFCMCDSWVSVNYFCSLRWFERRASPPPSLVALKWCECSIFKFFLFHAWFALTTAAPLCNSHCFSGFFFFFHPLFFLSIQVQSSTTSGVIRLDPPVAAQKNTLDSWTLQPSRNVCPHTHKHKVMLSHILPLSILHNRVVQRLLQERANVLLFMLALDEDESRFREWLSDVWCDWSN